MGCLDAILAATARHQTVIAAIGAAMLVEQGDQFLLAGLPIDVGILYLGVATRIADTILADIQAGDLAILGVAKFRCRGRTLVRHDAALAEMNFFGKAVISLKAA